MTQFVEQLRNQTKWYARPGHNARDLMDSHPLRNAADEIKRLVAKLEMAEKDITLKESIIDSLGSTLTAVANERDELRAKIEAMEKQEPVAWLYEAEYSSGSYSDNYFEWRITRNKSDLYGARKIKPLYKTPRAKGE